MQSMRAKPKDQARPKIARHQAAMTFDEIAQALGTTRQNVWFIYARAIRKLRRHAQACASLRELGGELEACRAQRGRVEV